MKKEEVQYFRLICLCEHYNKMLKAIESTNFSIKPGFPIPIYKKNNLIGYWVFELDVIYNSHDESQRFLIDLQEKYCKKNGA